MSRGILSGMAWGAAGGTALLTVLSLYTPLPSEKEEVQQSEVDAVQSEASEAASAATQSDVQAEPVETQEGEVVADASDETVSQSAPELAPSDEATAPEITQSDTQDTTQEVIVSVPEEEEAPIADELVDAELADAELTKAGAVASPGV